MKYTVFQLIEKIRVDLEGEYQNISLEGEVSNLSYSASGHWYFNLSDKDASIKCAIFKMDALHVPYLKQLKNGDKVEAFGKIGVYTKRGEFQLIAKKIIPAGQGDLLRKLEELKQRLSKEGLFDSQFKKPIPKLPRRIGVITAEKAAALQDFLNIFERRSLWMDIVLSPALVQGDLAPRSIVQALHRLIAYDQQSEPDKKLDLIVITRGDGSIEDLWAFNDEALAYEIFSCPIPIVSAVGHEVDYTICDFVADLRCETPSAAAEVITEGMVRIKQRIQYVQKALQGYGSLSLMTMRHKIARLSPLNVLSLVKELQHLSTLRIDKAKMSLSSAHFFRFPEYYRQLDYLWERLYSSMISRHQQLMIKLDSLQNLMNALGPNHILQRGYVIMSSDDGHIVDSAVNFDSKSAQSKLSIQFYDGKRAIKKENAI